LDFSAYKDVFVAEAREYIQALNDDLLALEKNPQDVEILDRMFRAAHSLKGMAGTMGYTRLQDFTHEMENTLNTLRSGGEVTTEIINDLFSTFDQLEILLEETINGDEAEGTTEEEPSQSPSEMAPSQGVRITELEREEIRHAEGRGQRAYDLHIRLKPNVLMKSVRAFTVFQALEGLGTIVGTEPERADIDEERFDDRFSILFLTHRSPEEIKGVIGNISEIAGVSVEARNIKEEEPTPAVASQMQGRRQQDPFIRVETERLDKLLNLVGELVISRTQVLELAAQLPNDSRAALLHLDRVTTELQYATSSLRMVPIRQVFDRFPRMVRDLAQAEGKPVDLHISGQETELDRSIVNELGEPLVHLIRNAIDHGLEPPEERQAAGKPRAGRLEIVARHEGSHIVIEIADDGRGIDLERIRLKAVDRGLLDPEATPSEGELLDLIFQPGFSTADQVTDISGRGVGMDAVRAAIQSLNGTVELQSKYGQGTKISIKLPLTLAIIKALMVGVKKEIYAIPIQAVQENILVQKDRIKTIQGRWVITLRNRVLPLLDLADYLHLGQTTEKESLPVIIISAGEEQVGLVVDELLGQQEVVIKTLDSQFASLPGIAGATILGNGHVALILDVANLVQHNLENQSKLLVHG
jgi:two-component system chemotaxis sensor kinase CheA